jgi:hypothetical protein
MVKTLMFKTIKNYNLIKNQLQEIINEHTTSSLKECGSIALTDDPKLHLFTSTFKDDDFRFKEALSLFNEIDNLKVKDGKIKIAEDNYGDVVVYLSLSKEHKKIIEKILALGGLKKNALSVTIGTLKENYDVSIEKREELRVLMRKVYSFFKNLTVTFDKAQSITI